VVDIEDPVPADRVRTAETTLEARAVACVPLRGDNGEAIGALAGLFRDSRQPLTASFSAGLALLAGLLARLLRHEIDALENRRRDERFRYEALTDPLTHLPNRRAWEEKLAIEHERAHRLGETSFVSIIDVGRGMPAESGEPSGIDDSSLHRTALTLRYAVRDRDFVARIDDSRFAILGLQCSTFDEENISARIRRALDRAGVAAAVGTAASDPAEGHEAIWRIAGDAMARDRRRLQGGANG
jgi:diguanylate cyclase (GGDEF)-like protein